MPHEEELRGSCWSRGRIARRTSRACSRGVGTTLLLVGIVVLLERRIVDTAAKAVRRAVDADREGERCADRTLGR
jgi:hypothetical protein